MSEKPQKRLVSKGRYAWVTAGRTVLVSASLFCSLIGLYGTLGIILTIYFALRTEPRGFDSTLLVALLIMASATTLVFFLAFCFFKKERKVERVAPITKHTTSSLPPADTLVRASDLPTSDQQAELLRGAMPGSETPPEEMLRASVTNGTIKQDG